MFSELDEVIRREIERSRLPGLAIALVKGDDIVWGAAPGRFVLYRHGFLLSMGVLI